MAIINSGAGQRLPELITVIVMDQAHMIFDSRRGRVANELLGSAR
jgi:replicative superfamily II helicase